MKKLFTARALCRAGIIGALYVTFTLVFGSIAYQGVLQIRPAEALCILPLFFPEAILGLTIGCAIANLGSPFFLYDVICGSSITLISAICTFFAGKWLKGWTAFFVGGLFPVLFNGFGIPLILVLATGGVGGAGLVATYFLYVSSILSTEAVWVYLLGAGLFAWLNKGRPIR